MKRKYLGLVAFFALTFTFASCSDDGIEGYCQCHGSLRKSSTFVNQPTMKLPLLIPILSPLFLLSLLLIIAAAAQDNEELERVPACHGPVSGWQYDKGEPEETVIGSSGSTGNTCIGGGKMDDPVQWQHTDGWSLLWFLLVHQC